MKLLYDQNLAHSLVASLQNLYPNSKHVRDVSLASASDDEVWNFARANGMTIVSKDTDFYHRSMYTALHQRLFGSGWVIVQRNKFAKCSLSSTPR